MSVVEFIRMGMTQSKNKINLGVNYHEDVLATVGRVSTAQTTNGSEGYDTASEGRTVHGMYSRGHVIFPSRHTPSHVVRR
jgi:hypothetical protein